MRHVALATAALALLLGACDSDRRAISRDELPEVPAEPDHVVELGDGGFSVGRLVVTADEFVQFTITGTGAHSVQAGDSIDSGPLFPGERTVVVFDEPDTYEVVDGENPDESMVVVSEAVADQ